MEIYILFTVLFVVLIAVLLIAIKMLGDTLTTSQKNTTDMQDKRLAELNTQLTERNNSLQKTVNDTLVQIETRLKSLQEDNNKFFAKSLVTVFPICLIFFTIHLSDTQTSANNIINYKKHLNQEYLSLLNLLAKDWNRYTKGLAKCKH